MRIGRREVLGGFLASTVATFPSRVLGSNFDRSVVIDGLGGLADPYAEAGSIHVSERGWRDWRKTGVDAVRITVFPVGNGADQWSAYRESIESHQYWMAANPGRFLLVDTAADIRRAKQEGSIAIVFGTQDTSMVGTELDRLATMREDGIRTVQLTYNTRNLSGDGAIETDNAGLSKLGRATIERIEEENLLLDLSHAGENTTAQAIDHATRPLTISHTGARALADHPRNTGDAAMKAIADKGGVIGLYFMPYLHAEMSPTAETVISHANHMLKIAGEDHIGIGTDNGPLPMPFDEQARRAMDEMQQERLDQGIAAPGEKIGFYPLVPDYNSLDRYRNFARDLRRSGWSERQLEKFFGLNFLRVYEEAWSGRTITSHVKAASKPPHS